MDNRRSSPNAKLRENEAALRARGVRRAALFGSRARGDNHPDSDIEIMVEIEPDASIDLFEYIAITQYLADLFPNRVDVANRNQLKALVRPYAEQQAVYALLTARALRNLIFGTIASLPRAVASLMHASTS